LYLDSSAFVKLVVEEDGSDLAAALWDGCDAAVSSRLAYPEVRAALCRACSSPGPRRSSSCRGDMGGLLGGDQNRRVQLAPVT